MRGVREGLRPTGGLFVKKFVVWAVAVVAAVVLPTAIAASGAVGSHAASGRSAPTPRHAQSLDRSRAAALKSATLDSRLVALQQMATRKGAPVAVASARAM